MSLPKQTLIEFLELVNHYPSPHNGQPIRIKQVDQSRFDLFFDKPRGLQATDISFIFSFVSMGVFVEHMLLSAQALGHGFTFNLKLPKEAELHGEGLVEFGTCSIAWNSLEPDSNLKKTLLFRQTSRKKYSQGVSPELSKSLQTIAANQHMQLTELDKQQASQAIWLNQRAVFDDMFDEPVRQELNHWMRYTQAQKQATKDGLSYDCMELNGRAMKYIVNHPKVLRMPGIAPLLKQYYLRTMRDDSDVFYMLAPFVTEENSFNVGMVIMKIWKEIAQAGAYLHPFGTIMSNHNAHQDFLQMAGVRSESRDNSYLVFIFRSGKSETPVASLRIPYDQQLLLEPLHA